MAKFRVGCVPYVNAVPLVWQFESLGAESPVEVVYDVPSRLPRLLESGDVDAILVSSYYALTKPGASFASDVCIASCGPVGSVRMLSKVAFHEIGKLALDSSSMTSNELALILLRRLHGIAPETETAAPDGDAMLQAHDACVLIGDVGMETQVPGTTSLDLGEAWTDLTGLPFVWAVWTALGEFPDGLRRSLADAYGAAVSDPQSWEKVLDLASTRVAWGRATVDRYLTDNVRFVFDMGAKDGLAAFAAELRSSPEARTPGVR